MKRSTDRIRTTHTGSLPRPPELLETMRAMAQGKPYGRAEYEKAIEKHVADTVKKQVAAGIDVVNDGETSKPSFQHYVAERLEGFEPRVPPGGLPAPFAPGGNGRDAVRFPDFYAYVRDHNPFINAIRMPPRVCVQPIRYVGHKQIARDIENLKKAMKAAAADEGFLPASAPITTMANEYYGSEEEYLTAYGEAMREEYKAILDAGLLLQIDYPAFVSSWDSRHDASLADYRRWMESRVELVNHALRGLPEDRIRFHTCYGVNFGPRITDMQLENVIDLFFRIRAGAYSFEAANPRHEHEWLVPKKVKLPDGKILIPGAVTHANVMVEHPEVVAQRMERWANTAGRENVIFGNDCGFQSTAGNEEIPISIAWAKLEALGEGARIASKRLWAS